MKTLFRTLALALIVTSSLSLSAQDKSAALHPEVLRYVQILDLNEEQTAQLQAVYETTAVRGEELDNEMQALNIKQREVMETATPSDKEQNREQMNALGTERKMLEMKRMETLEALCTDEQKALLHGKKGNASPY